MGANAFQAYKGEGGQEGLSDFMKGLALELLKNPLLTGGPAVSINTRNVSKRGRQHFAEGKEPAAGPVLSNVNGVGLHHMIRPLTVLKNYADKASPKLVCKMCGSAHARFLCVSCSQVEQGAFFGVCGPKSDNDCIGWHH